MFGELEKVTDLGCEYVSDFGVGCQEELPSFVHAVEASSGECAMKFIFENYRVIGEVKSVDVKRERYGRVTEFPDSIERFEPACHADLYDLVAEGPDSR